MYNPAEVFGKVDGSFRLYLAADEALMSFPGTRRRVSKTQVSYSAKRAFAWAWPPVRKVRGRPGTYIVLSFALGRKIISPRIEQALEVYPGRWMHHLILSEAGQLDDELALWIAEAHSFASR